MNLRTLISRLPGLGGIAKTYGWEQTMFGDLIGGSGSTAATSNLVQPYKRSAWVRSAIQFVAAPIAMRPLCITADRRGGDMPLEDMALTEFWERPARDNAGLMSRNDFIEATVGWMKLKGQAFWLMDDTWFSPRAKRSPLILANSNDMSAIYDGRELVGWVYVDAAGKRTQWVPDQVCHLKFWNPYDDVLGLAEWEAAMISAESDYAAGIFARNLSRNNGDRGPYVIGKGGTFTDEQIVQVSAQLRAKREMGQRGDFRAAFLPADVEVKEPALSSVDTAYVAQRLENRKEVYAAFGVPPSFADPQSSYSIGSASDRFRLIEDTCMPLAAKIADQMEIVSTRFLGKRQTLFVEFDWDSHSTLQQVRSERFGTAVEGVKLGMPWHEASEYFRLKLPRFAGDGVGRIPFNLTEITAEAPTAEDAPAPTAPADPVAELEQLFARRSQGTCGCGAAGHKAAPTAKAAEAWTRVRKYREPWEKKFESKVSRYLMDARAETLRKLAALETNKSATTKAFDPLSIIFDLGAFLGQWTTGLLGVSKAAMTQAGIEVWTDELGRDDPMTQPGAEVIIALKERENRITGAGTQVFEEVISEIQAGITAGDTQEQLGERIRRKFQGIDKQRGRAIAKTETTVAYEIARDIAFRAAGVQWKQWLTSGLGNERLSHLGANEQIVPIDEEFIVGGIPMKFPGDPAAPPKEVINCNCVSIAVAGPDGTDIEGNDPSAQIPY